MQDILHRPCHYEKRGEASLAQWGAIVEMRGISDYDNFFVEAELIGAAQWDIAGVLCMGCCACLGELRLS